MFVWDDEPPICEHISSIYSQNVNGDYVEVGWEALGSGVLDNPICHFTGDGQYHVFRYYRKANVDSCNVYQQLVQGTWHSFSVNDQNGDLSWTFSIDGSAVGPDVNMGWDQSSAVANGERYGSTESASADFEGLQYMGSDGAWHAWHSGACLNYYDPVYNDQIYQPDAVEVTPLPAQC